MARVTCPTMDPRLELVQLLAERSVRFGEFTLSSGKRSDYYVDARLTTMSPEGLRAVGTAGLRVLQERGWEADSTGGLTMGADPVAYAIAYASALEGERMVRAFSVRKDVKAHGTRRRIEGPFRDGDRVVIVEDVITTGASALTAAAAAEHEAAHVIGVLAVLDREEGGRQAIEARGYPVVALATAREVIALARQGHSAD
ncbi:orotate phosphoribosyltransferase [soil metagenome]